MNLPIGPIVYVMRGWGQPEMYKIGCTSNVYRRYQSTRSRERIVRILRIPEGTNQYGAEAAVHEWFDHCRCMGAGETFWLSEEDLKELSEMQIKHCKRCNRQWCYRGTGEPLRCGKCKSPYWNIPEYLTTTARESVKTAPANADRVDFYVNGAQVGSIAVPEREMCPVTAYDQETGETYRCGLPKHGANVKHTKGEKL